MQSQGQKPSITRGTRTRQCRFDFLRSFTFAVATVSQHFFYRMPGAGQVANLPGGRASWSTRLIALLQDPAMRITILRLSHAD